MTNTQQEYDELLEKLFAWEDWLDNHYSEYHQSQQSKELKDELDKFRPKPKPARVGNITVRASDGVMMLKGEPFSCLDRLVEYTEPVKERLGPTAGVNRLNLSILISEEYAITKGKMDEIMQLIADAAPEVEG